jgi:DMSO/TMAO reductase YedYZ molybdopterin-dependent catalytic subunit
MRDRRLILPDPKRRRLITGLGALGASAALTGCDSLSRNDQVQDLLGATDRLTRAAQRLVASRASLAREFPAGEIAATMRPNGSTNPNNADYRRHVANGFADWRLRIDGLVREPGEFSLDDLKTMPSRTQITRHDCVEGWSCIAQWTGAVLGDVLDRVRPSADARYVVFHCADNIYGGPVKYYESLDLVEARHPQTLLAYGLNGQPLPVANGAPLRLRAERQLGYKMAKYVMRLELVDSFAAIQGGNGGYWEDRGYEWWAGI